MKIFSTTALVLFLALAPLGVSVAEEPALPENITSILPNSANLHPDDHNNQQPTTSALDLSLFGIISLGVLGLFWIRRHTSEL